MPGMKSIFSSDPRRRGVTAIGASSPGFRFDAQLGAGGRSIGGGISRQNTPTQQAAAARFPRILSDIDTQRGTITPGFSKIREARLNAINRNRATAIGSLEENQRQRRVAGSSFGEAAVIDAEARFAEAEAEEQGQSFLDELNANIQLLQFESQQVFNQLQREFTEAGMAANFISSASQIINSNAQAAEESRIAQLAGQAQLGTQLFTQGAGFLADRVPLLQSPLTQARIKNLNRGGTGGFPPLTPII